MVTLLVLFKKKREKSIVHIISFSLSRICSDIIINQMKIICKHNYYGTVADLGKKFKDFFLINKSL